MTPPSLASLTSRYFASKAIATDEGDLAEVMPHEVITSFRADSAATWVDTKAAFTLLGAANVAVPMPPEWAAFVSQLREITVIPLCLGAVPQRMRDLLTTAPKMPESKAFVSSSNFPAIVKWIETQKKSGKAEECLLAASLLRGFGEFAAAEQLLNTIAPLCTGPLAAVLENERAALAWFQGDMAAALAIWNAMGEKPVALFNRAICEWMQGRPATATKLFDRAAGSIPDRSGWAHLAAFYASYCEGV